MNILGALVPRLSTAVPTQRVAEGPCYACSAPMSGCEGESLPLWGTVGRLTEHTTQQARPDASPCPTPRCSLAAVTQGMAENR